jgi:hypothetical protein
VNQQAGRQHDWLASDPPGVVFHRLGGPGEARRLAEEVAARLQLDRIIRGFREAFDQGMRDGRWDSVNGMAAFLGMHPSYAKRLLNGDPSYMANMKIGDLHRYAGKLRIGLGDESPAPECIERQVLHVVVQAMRDQRRNGSANGWPDLGKEEEAETIRRLSRRVGHIDDASSHEPRPWRDWLTAQAERIQTGEPVRHSSPCLLRLVGLGDWLVTRPYLPLFESQLYADLRAIERIAKERGDSKLQRDVWDFVGKLAEAQQLLRAFRESGNGTMAEAAGKLRLKHVEAVEIRMERVGLKAADFRGEEAMLGRLVLRSPVLRPLFLGLFSCREWSAGSADTPRGRSAT